MSRISRRVILSGVAVAACAAALTIAKPNLFYALITPATNGQTMTPDQAHKAALDSDVVLVDIRRPDEWAKTGSGASAHRIDLRRDDFAEALASLVQGEKDTRIALICARGVRSARTVNQLQEAGFTQIIDVPEGMLGSAAGPGWIARNLPLNLE